MLLPSPPYGFSYGEEVFTFQDCTPNSISTSNNLTVGPNQYSYIWCNTLDQSNLSYITKLSVILVTQKRFYSTRITRPFFKLSKDIYGNFTFRRKLVCKCLCWAWRIVLNVYIIRVGRSQRGAKTLLGIGAKFGHNFLQPATQKGFNPRS